MQTWQQRNENKTGLLVMLLQLLRTSIANACARIRFLLATLLLLDWCCKL